MTPSGIAATRDGEGGTGEYRIALAVLWKRRTFIAAGTIAVMLVTLLVTLLLPRNYDASAVLLIGPSSISDPTGSGPKSPVTAETFVSIIDSPSIAGEAIRRFQLDRPPHRLTPGRFLASAMSVRPVPRTNLVRVTVSLQEPELAASTANFIAETVIQMNARWIRNEAAATRDYVVGQRDQAAAALERAQAAQRDFKRDSNLDALRADLRISLEEKDRLQKLVAAITTEQVGLLAQVGEWSAALSKQEQFVTLRKSILTEPAAATALRQRGAEEKDLAGIHLENQEINTIHQGLRQQLINAQASLASFEEQRRDTGRKVADNDRRLARTWARLTTVEARLDELTHVYSLAKATHALMAKKVDEAELSVAARATELKLVEPASAQIEPPSRGLVLRATIAGLAGLAAFGALALGLDAVRRPGATPSARS